MNASAIIPTANRAPVLERTLESVCSQSCVPDEIIVIDASHDDSTREVCEKFPQVSYLRADRRGAAQQRAQGVDHAALPKILFLDDDIILEPECLARLDGALESSPRVGGAVAMITNQQFHPPGRLTRLILRVVGAHASELPGSKVGAVLPQLPWDNAEYPDIVPVEWMNMGCALYRREALPERLFPDAFFGACTCEDLALSLEVGRGWNLVNARTARIFHDSQGGDHKRSQAALAKMEIVNRHHIMTKILGLRSLRAHLNLILTQAFTLAGTLRQPGGLRAFPARLWGKLLGLGHIVTSRP